MSAHEQFADDLALHALGALSAPERAALEEHLRECAACRRELENLRGDMALLALSAAGPAPPQRARARLLAALAREPRMKAEPPRRSSPFTWNLAWQWAAVAAAVILAALLWRENAGLKSQLAQATRQAGEQQAQLEQARQVVDTLSATEASHFTLVAGKNAPQPQGKAIYLRNRGSLVFLASNLPATPPNKAYELWLIPATGAPVPAGVFIPDAHGSASVVNPPLPGGLEAKAFAITLEPAGGSSTPTMPILLAGTAD